MKFLNTLSVFALLTVGATGAAMAQMDHSKQNGAMPMKTAASNQVQLIEGLVKKVDKAGGKVLLAHGPTPDGMPGMTMAYPVKDPAWLDKMSAGQKIMFATSKRGAETIISQYEPAK
jgi:Cu(I)/Ag(I) efflux system periplasmic protein CusF